MAAAMTLGAQGVWMGSIWLTTHENDWEQVIVERMLSATSSDTVRSRCVTGKPARMLRSGYTEAWDSAESPGTLPMPLQFLAGAEAEQRIRRAIQAGSSSGAELSITPVGQIVGSMKQVRPVRQVVSDLVDGYLDAMERMARLMEETE